MTNPSRKYREILRVISLMHRRSIIKERTNKRYYKKSFCFGNAKIRHYVSTELVDLISTLS